MRLVLLFGFYILSSSFLFAQFQSGSPYSAFGIGDLYWQGRGQNAGLAGAGIAVRTGAFLNLSNPAAYTSMRSPYTMALETGLRVSSTKLSSSNEEATQRDGGLSDITLWLRPHKNWATVIGLQPYSEVGYSILSDRFLENIEANYTLINEGEGGLNRLFWGHATQLLPNLSIGMNANFLFGNISQKEQFLSAAEVGNFEVLSQTTLRGFNADIGAQWNLPIGEDQLVLGAIFQYDTRLWSRTDRELINQDNIIEEEGDGTRSTYRIPLKYGLGWSYQRPTWMLTAEATYENWASLDLEDTDAVFVDTWTGTFAWEVAPFKDKYQDYMQAFTIRTGVSYRNNYLEIDGQNFGHLLASLGFGIPLGPQRNHLHVAYSYQQRGQTNNGLIEEQTHQLSLSFTLRDVWFLQRKFN